MSTTYGVSIFDALFGFGLAFALFDTLSDDDEDEPTSPDDPPETPVGTEGDDDLRGGDGVEIFA